MDNSVNTTPVPEEKKPIALKLAGAGYIIGDLAGVAASFAREHNGGKRDLDTALGFATWFAGGVAAAFFGNPSKEQQLTLTAHKLQGYLQDRGIAIPKDAREQNNLLKKPHFLSSVTDFLHEHPSEMLNAMFAIGAGMLLKGGIKEIQKPTTRTFIKDEWVVKEKFVWPELPKKINPAELSAFAKRTNNVFWMGLLVGAGALSGLIIKENPAAREEAKDGSFTDKVLAYIKEKPLRLTSLLYATNNVFTTLKTVSDYSDFKGSGKMLKPHYFSGATAATYTMSNMLLHSVSRDQSAKGGYDAAEMARLEEMAATVIVSQPTEKQRAALNDVSAFLATQKNVKLNAPEIAEHLATRIAEKSKTQLLAVNSDAPPAQEVPASFAEKETARRAENADAEHTTQRG